MAKIAMMIDLERCVGCFACQNACKLVNNLPDGVIWLRVTPKEHKPEEVDGKLYHGSLPRARHSGYLRKLPGPHERPPAVVRQRVHGQGALDRRSRKGI